MNWFKYIVSVLFSLECMSRGISKWSHSVLFMFHTASQLIWNHGCISFVPLPPPSRNSQFLLVLWSSFYPNSGNSIFPWDSVEIIRGDILATSIICDITKSLEAKPSEVWEPEATRAKGLKMDFTLKKKTSRVQQLNLWNRNYLRSHVLWNVGY